MPASKRSTQQSGRNATQMHGDKLAPYHQKRDFERTPEPEGNGRVADHGQQFVVQKHAASRLHYDFRLELDGVLKSWAVPKGPSLDPQVRSLAVHVEDHPLEYANFEGIIPAGQYGGGTVMIWDRGTWTPEGNPQRDYAKGRLRFTLQGQKLSGAWTLTRMGGAAGESGKNWLLIKRRDASARNAADYDVLAAEPNSVVSDRSLDEIASDAARVWTGRGEVTSKKKPAAGSTQARAAASPARRKQSRSWRKSLARLSGARRTEQMILPPPMLATLRAEAPRGERWLHEVKLDGYRIQAVIQRNQVVLRTRQQNDWAARFATVAEALAASGLADLVMDGEVVVLNAQGLSDFQQLQNWMKRNTQQQLVYYVFDLPYASGYDLRGVPLLQRKQLLSTLIDEHFPSAADAIRYSDHILGDGPLIFQQTCQLGAEGIISKRVDSGYDDGRSRNWLKIKCLERQEFVIGGFTRPSGSRQGFGALLLGYYQDNQLVYCGRVGTGFDRGSLRTLAGELKKRAAQECPFDKRQLSDAEQRGVTWVRPDLVAEVEFTQWTEDGRLRHPSFQGLRDDKPPRQVVRETAVDGGAAETPARRKRETPRASRSGSRATKIAGVTLSNPDRVLYPQQGITKRHLAEYYESIAPWILPQIVQRPLTLVRCPQGRHKKCFYQKHLREQMPSALRAVEVQEKDGPASYVSVRDTAGLVALVQIGVLELHPWGSRSDRLERPDRIIWDLDPGEGSQWKDVLDGARRIRDLLAELGLTAFVRTSGGKGLHVVMPIERRSEWAEVKAFARSIANALVRTAPSKYVASASKSLRRGKTFIDYLRNDYGSTAVGSYSTRARDGAPVAMPLGWEELTMALRADQYHVGNARERLDSRGDPWEHFDSLKQDLRRALRQLQ